MLWIELWITCFCLATQDHIHIKQIMKRLLCVNVGLISFFVSGLNLHITQGHTTTLNLKLYIEKIEIFKPNIKITNIQPLKLENIQLHMS